MIVILLWFVRKYWFIFFPCESYCVIADLIVRNSSNVKTLPIHKEQNRNLLLEVHFSSFSSCIAKQHTPFVRCQKRIATIVHLQTIHTFLLLFFVALIHSIFPFLFTKTASCVVQEMAKHMEKREKC